MGFFEVAKILGFGSLIILAAGFVLSLLASVLSPAWFNRRDNSRPAVGVTLSLDAEDAPKILGQEETTKEKLVEIRNWPETIKLDFIQLFLGEYLGGGCARDVYEFIGQPDLVIKVETTAHSFQNVMEWNTWHEVQGTPWARFFAPCRRISPCGIVLIQERTKPLETDRLPKRLPAFFADLKPENFGRIGDRAVAHDYAVNLVGDLGLRKASMRYVRKDEWVTDPPVRDGGPLRERRHRWDHIPGATE